MNWSGLPEYIERKIIPEPNTGCWLWLGSLRDKKIGYGNAVWEGKTVYSHRIVYALLKGKIPTVLTLDHLCRCRVCCNPEHLEPCTIAQNTFRGEAITALNLKKTHCPKGHLYSEENTYWQRRKKPTQTGRICRECHRLNRKKKHENS